MEVGKRAWLLRGAVLGVALVVGIVAWAVSGDDGDEAVAPAAPEVRMVDEAELAEFAASVEFPVYWAGPMRGAGLELTRNADGSVQVRYVPEGGAGEESAATLTVATYPLEDPAGALEAFAAEPGSVSRRSRAGTRVVTSRENPSSVYFASPDNSVQVEVYDPSPKRALGLALSDRVRPAS